MSIRSLFLYLTFFVSVNLFAQDPALSVANEELLEIGHQLNYSSFDLINPVVTDQYTSKGITHIYFQQAVDQIGIFGTAAGIHIKGDEIISSNIHFLKGISKRALKNQLQVQALDALTNVAFTKGYPLISTNSVILEVDEVSPVQSTTISQSGVSNQSIPLKLVYIEDKNKDLQIAWSMFIDEIGEGNYINFVVNATTGEIEKEIDLTVTCTFEHHHSENCTHSASKVNSSITKEHSKTPSAQVEMANSYKVYPVPIESPHFGSQSTVTNPWDDASAAATPYDWHSTDVDSYTTTRGNNVDAYQDTDNSNAPTGGDAARVDGGASLIFNHDHIESNSHVANQPAAIVNLFYWNNIMHDIWYNYGFDEASGNFQEVNATGQGVGSDYVYAEAQDGGSTCNARMITPGDGANPRMQMYLCGGRDGDFDNVVIAHEYGHGISNRLTGGPASSSCLNNQEQMGEGWSDFFGLVMTIQAGDTPQKQRTIGTYLDQQPANGPGFRNYPYSTDMAVNPMTYDSIYAPTFSVPHGVGSVWCTMLWDMTWALIDHYGWDADLYNGTGGNNIAMHLVTLGLKLQPCSPGFVDGRDAILAADRVLYGGANECLIWNAFAKRGLGYSADQGISTNRSDGSEGYDLPPSCSVLLQKTADKLSATPGEEVTYTIFATNNLPFAEDDIVLKDFLPADMEYITSSPTATVSGQVITWPAFDLALGENTSFTVTAKVKDSTTPTDANFLDDLENGTANWVVANSGAATWNYQTTRSNSNAHAYHSPGISLASEPTLTSVRSFGISDSSELIFHHYYDIEMSGTGNFAWDGGIIEISTDFGQTWEDLGDKITQNGYNLPYHYTNLETSVFSGQSNGWIETKVDLSSYDNEQVLIQFKMLNDPSVFEEGWFVDDIRVTNQKLLTVNQTQAIYTNQVSNAYVDENTEIVFIELADCNENETTNINGSNIPTNDYRAANQITSAGVIQSTSEVNFYAGSMISLELGFHAEAGASFLAKIEDCEESGVSSFQTEEIETTAKVNTRSNSQNPLENTLAIRPNPFHNQAIIDYQVAQTGQLWIGLFDITGKVIQVLQPSTIQESGHYQLILDSQQLQSSAYWLSMRTTSNILTKKIFLVK